MTIDYDKFLTGTSKIKKIDYTKFLPKIKEPVETEAPTSLDTQFQQREQVELNQSLADFGIAPQPIGGISPLKTIKTLGGEARAESYYGKETVTPRTNIDYSKFGKRKDLLGTLKIEIDHIMPKALGGTDDQSNLRAEEAKRTILDIIKRTPSQELEHYKRQGGRLPAELQIIEDYQKGNINQIQALEAMGKLKETEMPTAFQLAVKEVKDKAKSVWNYLKKSSKASIDKFEEEQGIKATPLSILYGADIQEVNGRSQVVKTKSDYKLPVQQMAENILTAPLRIGASVHEAVTGKETSFKLPKIDEIMTYQKQYNEQVKAGMPKELSGLSTGVNALFDVLITYSMIKPLLNRPGKSVVEYDEAVTKGSGMTKPQAREILGVSKNATKKEIKKAFYNLAHKYHPDKTMNWNISQSQKDALTKQFLEVNNAYHLLTKVKPQTIINTSTAEAMKQDIMRQSANITVKPKTTVKPPISGVVAPAVGKEVIKSTITQPEITPKVEQPTITSVQKPQEAVTEVLDQKMTIEPTVQKTTEIEPLIQQAKGKSFKEFVGEQKILYHGTDKDFQTFKRDFLGTTSGTAPANMKGFYFTDNKQMAQSFGKQLKEVVVDIKNPFIVNAKNKTYSEFKHTLNNIFETVDKTKYDGLIIKNYKDAGIKSSKLFQGDQYIPFNENQIKTESQLKEIWEEAKKPETKLPVKETIKEKIEAKKEIPKKVQEKIETKKAFSKHYEKIKEEFGFEKEGVEIKRITNKNTLRKAFNYIQRNPEKAMRIAYGIEKAPPVKTQAIRQSMVVSLMEAGKIVQAQEIAKLLSGDFTEIAQALNLAKADLGRDERAITAHITQQRMEKIGRKLGEQDPKKAVERVKEKIKTETKKAKDEVVKNQASSKEQTLKELDDLIDSIIC